MWFTVRPSDITFADQSRKHFTYDFRLDAPPERAFELVTSPDHLASWVPGLAAARWVSAPPQAAGSLREVKLDTIHVQERVIVWEPGVRFVFTVVKASLPILQRMVEDYRFEPLADGTRVRWTIAYQPRLLATPLEPILAPRFARMFETAAKRLVELTRR